MRAFIFSLDAFVAFTLALIAIYSLIFFSSIPSSYYYLLTQGHFLSRDVLMALSTATCPQPPESAYDCSNYGASLLDNIVSSTDGNQKELVQETVGQMIPSQFGYTLESIDNNGVPTTIYDTTNTTMTANDPYPHAQTSNKLNISTEVMTFGYSSTTNKPPVSIYSYLTCSGTGSGGMGMITCSSNGNGNTNPNEGRDQVPSANVKVLKLTIFI